MKALEIHYEPIVYRQIMHWVCKKIKGEVSLKEVSGFCKVQVHGNIILATHAFLCPQEGSSAETDIDAEDLAKLEYETREIPGDLRLWFHSHPNMKAFWSTTDIDNIETLGGPGWMAATVFNEKWELRSAVYQTKPYVHFIDPIVTRVATYPPAELVQSWDNEFDKNVKSKVYTITEWEGHGLRDGYYNPGYPSGYRKYLDGPTKDIKPTEDTANNQILYEVLTEKEYALTEKVDDLEGLIAEEEERYKKIIRKRGKSKTSKPKRYAQLEKQLVEANKEWEELQIQMADLLDADADIEAGIKEGNITTVGEGDDIPGEGDDISQGNFALGPDDPEYPSCGIPSKERMV